jgi:hypothetical protein
LYDETPVYAFFPSSNPVDLVQSLMRISKIDGVTRLFGSHNTLGLDPAILHEVNRAVVYLLEHDLVRFGTGVHEFNSFRMQF